MIAGRYALTTEIGRGGMGVVWRGRDEVLEREVALKRIGLAPEGSSPDLRRAEREARLAASLHHPNVVSVFDLAIDGDEHWLVMEYVESRNLAQIVRDNGPLDQDAAALLLAQVADALSAAHEVGIVHRDVKPSNILVTASGQGKITDFGIARARADATLTQTGMVTGSPAYLAPEVAAGEPATPASDVWSLGATLFHALSGHPPYDIGGNVVGALYRIVHEDPPRLADAGWLAPVLEATMAARKDERWSMDQVRDVLRAGPGAATPPVPGALPSDATRQMDTVAAAPPPAPEPDRRPEPMPVGRPDPGPRTTHEPQPGSTSQDRRRTGAWVAAAVAAVVLGLLVWALADDDSPVTATNVVPDSSSTATDSSGESSDESSGESSEESDSPSDAASESSSDTPDEAPAEEDMQAFVEDYYATAPSDPETTWAQLTRGFQRESGGYGSYSGYWGTIESATVGDVTADPETMVVSFGVSYVRKDGSTSSDSVTLELVQDDDSFLVAGES